MRQLTSEEIKKLASRKGVRRIAVENFLSTMGTDSSAAWGNLESDTGLYGWNAPTRNAISAGISKAEHSAAAGAYGSAMERARRDWVRRGKPRG